MIKFDIQSWGSVKSLEILPLIDRKTDNPELLTESGVSYLIKADDTTILFDLGINQKTEHPSPLMQNMKKLGITSADFNTIFISHRHGDHCGGLKWAMNRTFGLSSIQTNLSHVKAFTPEEMNHPTATTEYIDKPKILSKGIASIGPIVQPMFFSGSAREQALVINVEEKGLVLVVGCGHQSVSTIVERTKNLVEEKIPIYAFIGGVHLPIPKFPNKNDWLGLPFYKFTGTRRPIWEPWTNKDVEDAIHSLKTCELVSISTHDSSDESIEQFRTEFRSKFVDLRVGTKISIK
jgi:7,8-dihydropterin-6-yl-methyl-4-(beta-D-ribofuranosyl)aminobenzene 5'-phosphate synthase